MTLFHVSWEIDVEADTIEEAAICALRVQRDSTSFATIFNVIPKCVECNLFHPSQRQAIDVMRTETKHVH